MSIPVAILGANGTVGQKAVAMVSNSSHFHIAEVAASAERVGKTYLQEVDWREESPMPVEVKELKFTALENVKSPAVISALPADVALELEPLLARRGIHVFSNASAFRMNSDVPLLIPEINLSHLELLKKQKTSGKIVTNPNCSTVFLVMALNPLRELANIKHLSVTTLQALSGAGFPGVASLDIMGNIIPNIGGEEEKIARESKKILGTPHKEANFTVSVQVNRVPIIHGHTISIHVEFDSPVSPRDVWAAFEKWNIKYPNLYCLYEDSFRPRPLRDLHTFDQRAHIGRIQQGGAPNRISLISLGHNLVRGAAGAAILNMKASLPYIKDNF